MKRGEFKLKILINMNKFHYFSLTEIFSQNDKEEIIDVMSNQYISDNMIRLLNILESIRTLFFYEPIYITSFYRNKKHNTKVGGASNSYHMLGAAVDVTTSDIPALISELSDFSGLIKYIHYPDKNFIHIQLKKPIK